MEVVSEELCTLVATVAVVDTEEGALGPVVYFTLLALGFHNVQDNGYSVLVIVSILFIT